MVVWTEADEWLWWPALKLSKTKVDESKILYKKEDMMGRRFIAVTAFTVFQGKKTVAKTLSDLLGIYANSTLLVDVEDASHIIVSPETSGSREKFDRVFELWARGKIKILRFFLAVARKKRNGRTEIIKTFRVPFPLWCTFYPAQGPNELGRIPEYYVLSYDEIMHERGVKRNVV